MKQSSLPQYFYPFYFVVVFFCFWFLILCSLYIFQEFEKEQDSPATSPLPSNLNDRANLSLNLMTNNTLMGSERISPHHHQEHSKSSANAAAAAAQAAHINGTSEYISSSKTTLCSVFCLINYNVTHNEEKEELIN